MLQLQLTVHFCPAGDDYGYFSAFIKYNQPPGWRYGQYDFRPSWDYYSQEDSDLEIAFDQSEEGYQQGTPTTALST